LNLQSDTQLKTQAKRSSSETLLKRSALDADRIDSAKIYPELIADLLMNGHKVKFRAPGYSMYPTILHEDVITVEPVDPAAVRVGDIALYRNDTSVIAHRIIKILKRSEINSHSAPQGPQDRSASPIEAGPSTSETLLFILRGDARPACDDPVGAEQILGKIVSIETNGRKINPYGFKAKLIFNIRPWVLRLKKFLNSSEFQNTIPQKTCHCEERKRRSNL
jgi:signal peptidase I